MNANGNESPWPKTGGAYRGRKKAEQAVELAERSAAGEPKALLAREFGISRETVYQYPRPIH